MNQGYGRWPESSWVSGDTDWKLAGKITAGIDVGTTSTQAVVMCDGHLYGYANIRTGADFRGAADKALTMAMGTGGLERSRLDAVVGTGFGKQNIAGDCKLTDEIHCHAKGARYLFGPEARTVVDMGGQTVKAIRLYEWDRVRDFMINDKCATGEGRSLETLCDLIHVPITEIGAKSLEAEQDPEPVSTTCWAYANIETIGLFGRPEFKCRKLTEAEIYASHLFAFAWRILGVLGRLSPLDVGEIQVDGGLGLTGGLAKNVGIVRRIERELGVTAMKSRLDPMLAGAIGAALLAE